MLRERFKDFARDTEAVGTERVNAVNLIADQLINAGHSDAASIAESKDHLNERWSDLLELMETRAQMLHASWEYHKFFHDCKDVLGRILVRYTEKKVSFMYITSPLFIVIIAYIVIGKAECYV